MSVLRPHPHRGDVIAAGAVPLAIASVLIELRMRQWSLGLRFLPVALIGGLILTMGWLAPLEHDTPRPYHSILLIAGLLPLLVALVLFAEVLGAHRPPGSGAIAWVFGAEAAVAAAAARRANSGACTLLAALAGAVAVEAFVNWAFHPHGTATFRAILLVLTLGFTAGAVRLRDRHRRHAVQLINAGGIAAVALAITYLAATFVVSTFPGSAPLGQSGAPFGWKLYLLAVGFGLVAYAGADREPGPGYIGLAVLLAFALLSGVSPAHRGSLVGWPLFLLVIGAGGIGIGLRPRKPLPPSPDPHPGVPPSPTTPLRPADGDQ